MCEEIYTGPHKICYNLSNSMSNRGSIGNGASKYLENTTKLEDENEKS